MPLALGLVLTFGSISALLILVIFVQRGLIPFGRLLRRLVTGGQYKPAAAHAANSYDNGGNLDSNGERPALRLDTY